MSNPYTNFNNAQGLHFPRTASEEQPYGVAAAAALKSLGVQNLDTFMNCAQAWASGSDAAARYSDAGFVPAVEQFSATGADAGAFSTAPAGAAVIRRFGQGQAEYWAGGEALPYHFAQLVGFYRRNQEAAEYGNSLQGLVNNLPALNSSDLASTYSALSVDFNAFLNDPVANADVVRASSLMAAIQLDEPDIGPAPEYDGENGLTAEASNPGSNLWRAPGEVFNYVIDVTSADTSGDTNPFILAAEEFNTRTTSGASGFINVPSVGAPGDVPKIAVLLPERTLTARTVINTPLGSTTSGQVATFNLDGKRADIHFVAPWASTSLDLAQARLDTRDNTNVTYKSVLSAGSTGSSDSSQLMLGLSNIAADLNVQFWCLELEGAASRTLFVGPDTSVGNESGLGRLDVKLNMCKLGDKKPSTAVPPCLYGIEVNYARLNVNGLYMDLPYTQSHGIYLNNARKGNMDLLNVQTVRAGGGALFATRDNTAVDASPEAAGDGVLTLRDWNCPDSWTSRLTTNASHVINVAGIHQSLVVDNCVINEDDVAAGRATDTWATAQHLDATTIGSTFAYTSPLLAVRTSQDGITLGSPAANQYYSETVTVTNCDLFSEAPFGYLVRIDSADTVNVSDSDIFAGVTTPIAGPAGETVPDQGIYFAPNNLGDLPQAPSSGLIRNANLEDVNATTPAGATDPDLYGGGDPGTIAPEQINTGSPITASDGISFQVFTGGAWEPESGNPALGDFNALLATYNTVYQNKDLRYLPLLQGRIDVDTRSTLLDGDAAGSQGAYVTQMRTLGMADDRNIDDYRNPWAMIQYNFSGGPIFLKDGTTSPYYELSHPVIYQFIRNNSKKYFFVFDPNIPQSADWDEAAKTGYGPQYVRIIREQSYQYAGGSYDKRPRWAVNAGNARNFRPDSNGNPVEDKWEVTNLFEGRVTVTSGANADPYADRFKGLTEPFLGRHTEGSNSGDPVWPAPSIGWDISVVTDENSGNPRCQVDLKTQYMSHWWTNATSWSFGQSQNGEFFRRVNGVDSLRTGYDIDPGTYIIDNVRQCHDTVNTFGQNSANPHWLNRGKSDNIIVRDSDLSDIRKEHLLYFNCPGDIGLYRSTFRRAGSQSVQIANRCWHYGPYSNIEDMSFGPLLQNVQRPTRDTTTSFPSNPPSTAPLNDVRVPDYDFDYPFFGNQYSPDNSPEHRRGTVIVDDCHFIDSARGGARPAFALTLFCKGSSLYPTKIDISNSSWTGAYVGRVKPNASAVDMLDVTDVLAHGTDNSEPFYYTTSRGDFRSGGALVMSTTSSSLYGKSQEVIRHVRTVDLSAEATDVDKAAWLEANLTEAPYQIAPGRFDKYHLVNNMDYQWPGPGRSTSTAWASGSTGGSEYTYWKNFMRNFYASASWPINNEGYQAKVPFNGANEWGVRDSSTGNMWWYNNDVRYYEPDGAGGFKFVDRWINLGPITGNPRTQIKFENCLWDMMACEKTGIVSIRSGDHITLDTCAFVNRRDDNPAKSSNLASMDRSMSIQIDRQAPGPGDGFSEQRGTRSRRVTLNNIFARPNNIPGNLDMQWFESAAYHAAVQGTPQEVVAANGSRRWDNIIGPTDIHLGKVTALPGYSPAGEGIGGYRGAGDSAATSDNTVNMGLRLSGLDLRGETVEFVLVPGTGNLDGSPANATFLADWQTAGYPLPELATDVTFPDGENHEYLKYPAVFVPYIEDTVNTPLREWNWVALWNGTLYTDGTALFNALPKVAGWIDPETFSY